MDGSEVGEAYATSRDGTRIGYWYRGSGPGLVLVQGAMGTAYNFNDLAKALGTRFSVYTPDRRGRGMSLKQYNNEHEVARDIEDIDAILTETGATRIFSLSSGAIIALEAARTLPKITQASLYEPPFYPDGISHDGIVQLNSEIGQGKIARTLVTALLVAETAPAAFQLLPKPFLQFLTFVVLRIDDWVSTPYAKLRDLLPGIRFDFNVVGGMDGKIDTFRSIKIPILLLSGTKSPTFLRQSTQKLKEVLPRAYHTELNGLGHSGPWNTGRGGSPEVVAAVLQNFFS